MPELRGLRGAGGRDVRADGVQSAAADQRRFKRASARKLAELQERDLSAYDWVGLFLDGKTFGEDEMVIALGVTLSGEKVVLGFVQTATENEPVCTRFLRGLVDPPRRAA